MRRGGGANHLHHACQHRCVGLITPRVGGGFAHRDAAEYPRAAPALRTEPPAPPGDPFQSRRGGFDTHALTDAAVTDPAHRQGHGQTIVSRRCGTRWAWAIHRSRAHKRRHRRDECVRLADGLARPRRGTPRADGPAITGTLPISKGGTARLPPPRPGTR